MPKREIVLVLHDIRSLYNVGAFFRTADAFGVAKIYLCGITGRPDEHDGRKKIPKTALGAEQFIPWEYVKSTKTQISKLKNEGYQIVSLEQTKNSKKISSTKFKNNVALVVGNEIKGISKPILKISDLIVEIPMLGQKESLNVSVAGGIALYALRSKA